MRFDIHFRHDITEKIQGIVGDIKDWNVEEGITASSIEELADYITVFDHCPVPDRPFLIGGADGSGDFPCVTYGDSVVYLVVAMSRIFEASTIGKLIEKDVKGTDIVDFMWLPEDKRKAAGCFDDTFARLVGEPLEDICQNSDYFELKHRFGSRLPSPIDMISKLIRPDAHDADNIGIQLMSTAEASTLIRLMKTNIIQQHGTMPVYLLQDTTLAMPMLPSTSVLFFEVAKRYACTIARRNGLVFMTVSKSHNMPHMDLIEDMITKKFETQEHWFIRIPHKDIGEEKPEFLGTRQIPPHGAMSYLFRFHKTTQPMRLDMDLEYWRAHIWNADKSVMRQNEIQVFRDLDFASHDQRCYGYPYPIKACHDIASLTDDERVVMRKKIIDTAVMNGLKRKNFIDPSIPTGHK